MESLSMGALRGNLRSERDISETGYQVCERTELIQKGQGSQCNRLGRGLGGGQ